MSTRDSSQSGPESRRSVELPALRRYINILGPLVMIVALCLIMAVSQPRFFGVPNMMIILHDAAIFMVLGMAMTLVISARGIDLSIGAVATLSAILMGLLIKDHGVNVYLAMAVALVVGLLCGLINSLVITQLKVPDLLATLAMDQVLSRARAGGRGRRRARPVSRADSVHRSRAHSRGHPGLGGHRNFALAAGVILYRYTHFGRYSAAIGGNREAAVLAGVNVSRHKIYQYVLMGGAAAVAGILLTGRLNAIQATAGQGLALHTIAGGRGRGHGAVRRPRHHARHAVGVLLLAMVTNALVILRFQFFWQLVASGIVIIASIGFYSYLHRSGDDEGKEDL